MKKAVKKLLKEAYNSSDVCKDWKDKIKDVYPKVEVKRPRVGDWYVDDNSPKDNLVYIIDLDDDSVKGYGFDSNGDWMDDDGTYSWGFSKNARLATDEEVEKSLIEEAKKRGFKQGVKINRLDNYYYMRDCCNILKGQLRFEESNVLSCYSRNNMGSIAVFNSGKWATIAEDTITKAEAEKQLGKTIID